MVAVRELLDLGARGLGDHLVAKADAKDGHLADELGGLGVDARQLARVARAVGEEHAVRLGGKNLLGRGVPGHDAHVQAHAHEAAQDAALLAAVEGDDLVGLARLVEVDLSRDLVGLRRGDLGNPVGLGDGGGGLHAGHEARRVQVLRGDGAAHGARLADVEGDLARVHALDGHDAALGEEVGQAALSAPVVGGMAHVGHDDTRKRHAVGLHVGGADAVVANLRIGERHNLAGVGWVGDDLLVAGHGRIEDELAEGLAGSPDRESLERGSILERKQRSGGPGCQQWVHACPFLSGARRTAQKRRPDHVRRRPHKTGASVRDVPFGPT